MFLVRKILVVSLLIAYPIGLCTSDVMAARDRKSRSSKNKKRKTKSKRQSESASLVKNTSSGASSTETANSTVETSATTATPQTQAQEVASETVATAPEAQVSGNANATDVSSDPQWEDFRVCMQQNCAGSDSQPNNVECYKAVNFDTAFLTCKALIEDSKRISFQEYFKGPFLRKEKKEFCEGEFYHGKFEEASGRCAVTVEYKRAKYSGKQFSCSALSIPKTWYLDNKTYVCSGDDFGADVCYQDSANYSAAQIQKWTGVAQLAMGAVSATVAGIQAAKSVSSTVKVADGEDKDKNPIYKDVVVKSADGLEKYKGLNDSDIARVKSETGKGSKAIEGLSAGMMAASGSLSDGGTALANGIILSKQKGDRLFGACHLSNGEIVSEGGTIKLSW